MASTVPALVNSAPLSVTSRDVPARRPPHAAAGTLGPWRPFAVGERLTYNVKFGIIRVGSGSMEVAPMDTVRGQTVWHTVFRTEGGTFFYHVDDMLESWFDTASLLLLRFVQHIHEGGYIRYRTYEIYPERAVFVYNQKPEQASVSDPLDDGSFLYFIPNPPARGWGDLHVQSLFRPQVESCHHPCAAPRTDHVPAGTFNAIVVQPIIKTKGILSKDGQARGLVLRRLDTSHAADEVQVELRLHRLVLAVLRFRSWAPRRRSDAPR